MNDAGLRSRLDGLAAAEMVDSILSESPYDFSGLEALFINCTLKPNPENR